MSEDRFTSPYSKKPPSRPPQRNVVITLSIRVLRGLINQLEGIISQLENPSSLENYHNREQRKRFRWIQLSRILSPVRQILPYSINRKLPDSILAIAIGAILIIVFTQIIKYFPHRELPLEIAEINSSEPQNEEIIIEKPTEEIPIEPLLPKPQADLIEPLPLESLPEIPSKLDEIETTPEIEVETISEAENPNKIPEILMATAPPIPVDFISPQTLELTPEQYLIKTIQQKMIASIAKINPEILVSAQANFSVNLLRVELSESWYELTESQQNEISKILLKKSQEFDFTRLQLIEASGKPLARTAVIGSNMIILNRIKSAT